MLCVQFPDTQDSCCLQQALLLTVIHDHDVLLARLHTAIQVVVEIKEKLRPQLRCKGKLFDSHKSFTCSEGAFMTAQLVLHNEDFICCDNEQKQVCISPSCPGTSVE